MRLLLLLLAATPVFAQSSTPAPIFSKLFGGSAGSDSASALAVDPNGNVAVTGITDSPDFPVTGAAQASSGNAPLIAITSSGMSYPPIGAINIAALAASSDGSVLYAASESGIYRSVNQGASWTRQNSTLAGATSLAVDGGSPSVVYATFANRTIGVAGTFKSTDAGVTWVSISSRTGALFTPAQLPGVVYLFSGGIFMSTDGGATWSANLAPHNYNVFAMAIAPSDPRAVYAVASDGNLYKSSDGGETWTEPGAMFTAYPANSTLYIGALAVSSTDENTLWAAQESGALFKSTDGGATFSTAAQFNTNVLSLSISGQNIALIGQGGANISFNGGTSWQSENRPGTALALPGSILIGTSGNTQSFLTKWSSDGSTILFSTVLALELSGSAPPVASDSSGDTWTATTSLFEFDPLGKELVSQSLNGLTARGMAIDPEGNVYVDAYNYNGTTSDCSAPASQNGSIPLVMKFSSQGALLYSTPVPQVCPAVVYGIAADASGNVYLAGNTGSLALPATPTAIEPGAPLPPSVNSQGTGFLAMIGSSGANLTYLSYLGGINSAAYGVAVDPSGTVYVTGSSGGTSLPLPVTATLGSCPQVPTADAFAFAVKLNPASAAPAWADQISCPGLSRGGQIALDSAGNVWVGGVTSSAFFPTLSPFEVQGQDEGFLSEISADGTKLLLSSYAPGEFALGPGNTLYLVGAETPNPSKGSAGPFGESTATSALVESFRLYGTQTSVIDAIPSVLPSNGNPASPLLGFAPGELIQITGRGLGPSAALGAQIGANGRVTTSLGGVSVLFNGVAAPLLSVQENSITCMAPFELDNQTSALIQIEQNGSTTPGVLAGVKPVSLTPEVLAVANVDGTLNSQSNPAHAGEPLILYVSGFGDTNPSVPDGSVYQSPLPAALYPVTVYGGHVAYAGPAPGMVAGVWQVSLIGLPAQSPDAVGLSSTYMIGPYQVSVEFSAWIAP